MKKTFKLISSVVPVIAAGLLLVSSAQRANALTQTWSEEFNGAIGSMPSGSTWNMETGTGIWGTGEIETMRNSADNASIVSDAGADGNALFIKADTSNGQWNGTWYSARMDSNNKHLIAPGHEIKFHVRCPSGGQGYWPACWLMGNLGGWPGCGEVDVMEEANGNNTIFQTIHMTSTGSTDLTYNGLGVHNGVPNANAYFLCAMDWPADGSYIKFWLNGVNTATFTSAYAQSLGGVWPFTTNNRLYLILDVAIGGGFPGGGPNSSTVPGRGMHVDWIRGYSL